MENQQDKAINPDFCPWCNLYTTIIWVHGHGQRLIYGTNIDECRRGEICEIPDVSQNIEKNISDE